MLSIVDDTPELRVLSTIPGFNSRIHDSLAVPAGISDRLPSGRAGRRGSRYRATRCLMDRCGGEVDALLHNTLAITNVLSVLDALEIAAEPNRRRLLHLLARQEQAVGELAAHFTVSRSAVSQHLLLLEQAGLVAARKEGRNRYYRLDPQGMGRLRALVEQFWTDELDLLAADAAAFAENRQRPGNTALPQ